MGRMKDSLVDRPTTIGDLKRQGVLAFRVKCQRPCRRIGRVNIEALRLPDETVVRDIPKLRRLRCEMCDRREPDIEPIWPMREAEPVGGIDFGGTAQWTVFIQMVDGRPGVSSPLWSRGHAAQFARREITEGRRVVRIETPDGPIDGGDVEAWCDEAGRS